MEPECPLLCFGPPPSRSRRKGLVFHGLRLVFRSLALRNPGEFDQ